MGSKSEAEKAPYKVEPVYGYAENVVYMISGPTPITGFWEDERDANGECENFNAAYAAGLSAQGEQTGDPAPTVEAIAAEIERWYLGLSDKPHQDGVLMLDRKANGYVLSDEERTRLRSRLTALYASPPTVEPVADPDAHILDQEDYLKAKQERFKGSGWAKDDASPKGGQLSGNSGELGNSPKEEQDPQH